METADVSSDVFSSAASSAIPVFFYQTVQQSSNGVTSSADELIRRLCSSRNDRSKENTIRKQRIATITQLNTIT